MPGNPVKYRVVANLRGKKQSIFDSDFVNRLLRCFLYVFKEGERRRVQGSIDFIGFLRLSSVL